MNRWIPVAFATLVACDPSAPAQPHRVTPVAVAGLDLTPATDGVVPPSFRATVRLTGALDSDALGLRVALVGGAVDDTVLAAFARGNPTTAQREREIPLTLVRLETTLVLQPTRAVPEGSYTLVVALPARTPFVSTLRVSGAAPPRRVWPAATLTPSGAATFCVPLPSPCPDPIEWLGVDGSVHEATITKRLDMECLEIAAPLDEGTYLLPPTLGDVPIDPAPTVVENRPARALAGCDEETALGPGLCARIDDDRVVLVGRDPVAVFLGTVAGQAVVAPLVAGARATLRGLAPSSLVRVDGVLRSDTDTPISTTLTTRPRRRHVVVNEVLARPPSGSVVQRFVELGNDGDQAVDLLGLVLLDGTDRIALPSAVVPPGGLVLVVGIGFSGGLAGDAAPPKGTAIVYVPTLRLSGDVGLLERDGTLLSRLPGLSSTKKVSRGRRALGLPDDLAGAFGWDESGRATPGKPNRIAP